jgi:hypothetical protein
MDNSTWLGMKDIISEHLKWIKMFTGDIDPKDIISKECGYSIEDAKKAMNESLNGSIKWRRFLIWMETNFPVLFNNWQLSDVKETGNNISRHFETVLMLDEQILKYADDMDIKLTYEYDGFGVFHKEEDKDINDKLKFITSYIQNQSKINWGITPFIKIKNVSLT